MNARGIGVCCALWLLLAAPAAGIVFEERAFGSAAQEQRYRTMIEELRCLVCQNQSLADSEAQLAGDLRTQVFTMITAGATDQEILDYMVERYGDFVLYRPPMKPETTPLWIGPFVLAALGFWLLFNQVRKRRSLEEAPALSADEQHRLQALTEASGQQERPE